MTARKDIPIGTRFGKRVVISEELSRVGYVLCRCDCGKEDEVGKRHLLAGVARACRGCSTTRHARSHSVEYDAWANMHARCKGRGGRGVSKYVEKGIKVCPKWTGPGGFAVFFAHVGPRPSDKHSIDRIDVYGDYEPANVRWATPEQQARNTTRNRKLTVDGVTKTMAEWAELSPVTDMAIRYRLKIGRTPHDAVFTEARG